MKNIKVQQNINQEFQLDLHKLVKGLFIILTTCHFQEPQQNTITSPPIPTLANMKQNTTQVPRMQR